MLLVAQEVFDLGGQLVGRQHLEPLGLGVGGGADLGLGAGFGRGAGFGGVVDLLELVAEVEDFLRDQ